MITLFVLAAAAAYTVELTYYRTDDATALQKAGWTIESARSRLLAGNVRSRIALRLQPGEVKPTNDSIIAGSVGLFERAGRPLLQLNVPSFLEIQRLRFKPCQEYRMISTRLDNGRRTRLELKTLRVSDGSC